MADTDSGTTSPSPVTRSARISPLARSSSTASFIDWMRLPFLRMCSITSRAMRAASALVRADVPASVRRLRGAVVFAVTSPILRMIVCTDRPSSWAASA